MTVTDQVDQAPVYPDPSGYPGRRAATASDVMAVLVLVGDEGQALWATRVAW